MKMQIHSYLSIKSNRNDSIQMYIFMDCQENVFLNTACLMMTKISGSPLSICNNMAFTEHTVLYRAASKNQKHYFVFMEKHFSEHSLSQKSDWITSIYFTITTKTSYRDILP